ncbi:MAG: branched-chain amino acid ABC transporter permease [Deltaproteobacteria bacterium]|jgi:branched-chain amino acid transport system permease protein|nr:branched-chain amino acid ABC transporter permease [Deltaproteobacteria bacterium]
MIIRLSTKMIGLGVLGVLVILLPFLPKYGPLVIHIGSMIGIMSILTLSLHIFFGLCGQINFGLNGFYACGAYSLALILKYTGMHYVAAIPIALIAVAVITLVVGMAVLRLREWVMALGTASFGLAVWLSVKTIGADIFGADDGLDLPPLMIGDWMATPIFFYYAIMVFTVTCTVVAYFLSRSRVGRAMKAFREDEVAASTMGVDINHYARIGFLLCGLYAGLAGILYATWNQWISPGSITLHLSIFPMIAVVVGGVGSVAGAIVGTVILKILPEIFLPLREYQVLMEAVVLFLVIRFAPQGTVGILRVFRSWLVKALSRETKTVGYEG